MKEPKTIVSMSCTGSRAEGFTARLFANGELVHQVKRAQMSEALLALGVAPVEMTRPPALAPSYKASW